MKSLILEALDYYRNVEQMNGVILFHVKNCYKAYQDSAFEISVICGVKLEYEEDIAIAGFPEESLQTMLPKIYTHKSQYHIIEYRNELGNFDVPKVKQFLEDMDSDY